MRLNDNEPTTGGAAGNTIVVGVMIIDGVQFLYVPTRPNAPTRIVDSHTVTLEYAWQEPPAEHDLYAWNAGPPAWPWPLPPRELGHRGRDPEEPETPPPKRAGAAPTAPAVTAVTMTTTRWMKYRDLPWAYADSGTCRVCGCEKEEGERWQTFCKNDGEACLHWYKIRSDPGYARRCVERRDKGVCALCGLDVPALVEEMKKLDEDWRDPKKRAAQVELLHRHGFKLTGSFCYWKCAQWEADHVVPVVEGGGMCDLDGLRTLCLPCHHKETAALAGRRARQRHAERHPGHFLD